MVSRLRSLLMNNWLAKLVCLGLAVGLWFWVIQQQSAERSFDVQIEYKNLGQDLVVTNQSDRFVTVTLRGPTSALNNMNPSELKVRIDLAGVVPGEEFIWIQPRDVQHPSGLEVVSLKPRSVHVVLERRLEKQVPVRVNVATAPPEAFKFQVQVVPDTAVIFGPDYAVRQLKEIHLEPLSLENRTSSFERDHMRAMLPENVQLDYPSQNGFKVAVSIQERQVTRSIDSIPVRVANVPPGKEAVVEPSHISLTVRGPMRRVQRLTPEDFRVEVDAPEGDRNLAITLANITPPEGVTIVNGQSEQRMVKVRLQKP